MFHRDVLKVDAAEVCQKVQDSIAEQVQGVLRRKGAVLGLSGGIDSSVVAALCARALGPERVLGILMPERHSAPESAELALLLADAIGIKTLTEDISPALEGLGCYRRQDEAIRAVFPDYQPGQRFKITLPSILEGNRLNVFRLTVETEPGKQVVSRMPVGAYLQMVAATNFKQRTRKMLEYYHADRLGYAVAGTPNRLEYDQGFFVKQGDGAADFKPIAHLYKTQVYAIAEHLGVPAEIRRRPPTTDTYSMEQTQEEFYFALPYQKMDLCLYGYSHGVPADELGAALELTPDQVELVYRDIESKRRTTAYLHQPPLLVEPLRHQA